MGRKVRVSLVMDFDTGDPDPEFPDEPYSYASLLDHKWTVEELEGCRNIKRDGDEIVAEIVKADVPNSNGVSYTKECLHNAMREYMHKRN